MIGLMMLAAVSATSPETAGALLQSCRAPEADACARYVAGSVETYLALGPDAKDFCAAVFLSPALMVGISRFYAREREAASEDKKGAAESLSDAGDA